MATHPDKDPEYLEIQITVRNKVTGEAFERTYFRTQDLQFYTDNHGKRLDAVISFTALRDPGHNNFIELVKDLGIAEPCTCYEKLTGT